MKKLKFYVCENCGNIVTSTQETCVSCCGKNLYPQTPQKADETHMLNMETIEGEWFLSTSHPMDKDHYISFSALVTGDKVLLSKHYSQWDLQVYFTKLGHGYIYWYCTNHGLFYTLV